jgi:rubrerythrin
MNAQVKELLYQMLETELGGVQVYTSALECVVNDELEEEWTKYLEQTERHVDIVRQLLETLRLDPDAQTPGRQVVKHIGESLVQAMQMALASGGEPEAAELVACECVVFAETKDHMNWELLSKFAQKAQGAEKEALAAACQQVEDQEDEHIYHSKGWCRELWIQSLGMPAVLPPPEEERKVKTALGAAHAEKAREEML